MKGTDNPDSVRGELGKKRNREGGGGTFADAPEKWP